jgi:hypothetical protein
VTGTTTSGVIPTYKKGAPQWTKITIENIPEGYSIIGASATPYLTTTYSTQTWDIGKNQGGEDGYLAAEDTMYWSNGLHIKWTGADLWILNTNAKRYTKVSWIAILQKS